MIQPVPTVTLCIVASQMSAVLARLSTFLVQARHGFLHTFHSPGQVDLDIFDQHQRLLMRCTIQVVEADAAVPAPLVSAVPGTLAADLLSLLHDLVQVGPASEPHGEDDNER